MNRTILAVAGVLSASSLLLVDSAIKGTLLLALAAVVALILRRDSAATRHLVWLLAIVAMLVVPLLSVMLPQWRVLPGWMSPSPNLAVVDVSPPLIVNSPGAKYPGEMIESPGRAAPVEAERPSPTVFQPATVLPDSQPALAIPDAVPAPAERTWSWINALPLVWVIGFFVLILRLSAARWMLWNSERRATVVCRRFAPQLASKSRSDSDAPNDPIVMAMEAVCSQLGIVHSVTLLIHPDKTIPVVWGILRCRLMLPAAARQWSDEQLQSVLLHELAHIKRRDTLVQLLTQVACALHWFNPLVWFAAWRLDVERERSCDDLVLASGIRPSAYAGHLLDVVTGLSPARWTQACGLAMARKSSLEGRLTAVLGKDLNRRGVSVALAGLALTIAVGIAVPIAMLRAAEEKPIGTVQQPELEPKEQTKDESQMPKEYGPQDWAGWFVNQVQYRKQSDGSYPAVAFKSLRKWVGDDLASEPNALGAVEARSWLEATAADKKWAADDFVSLVERIGKWRLSVIQRALPEEESASRSFPKPGRPATAAELRDLRFGPATGNGLRIAWVFDPAKKDYAIGQCLLCRVMLHNSGSQPVQFVAEDVIDGVWTIRDATGKPIHTEGVDYGRYWIAPRMETYQRYRLAPGHIVEIHGKGIGIGDADHSAAKNQMAIWRIIHARAGDAVQISVETNLGLVQRFGEFSSGELTVDEFPEEKNRDWSGSLGSGEVKFNVVAAAVPKIEEPKEGAQLKPTTEQKLKWGEPVNGLRMALAYPPALGDALLGKEPFFQLVVQNVSEKEVHFLASDAAPNPRRMFIREGERIVTGLSDPDLSAADWKLQPDQCGVIRLFTNEVRGTDGTTPSSAVEGDLSKIGRYHAIVQMEIAKAPAGAWTGKLVTGPTRGSADVPAAPAPMHKDARAYYEIWQRYARGNGDIPGALVGELAGGVKQFIKYNPTWETVPKLKALLPRLDATRDWKAAEAIALLDEVAGIQDSPLKPMPWKGTRQTIRQGDALPKKFAAAPWGDLQPNGLRAAWVLEPGGAEHRIGAALRARLLVQNSGQIPVMVQVPTFHQGEVKATDAKGAEVQVSGIYWTTMAQLVPVRLGPGEFIEIYTPGVGLGPRAGMGPWAGPRVGSNVLAKPGDELTLTHGLVPLDGREVGVSEDAPHVSGLGWWLAHIKARLNRVLPLPADAAERTRLLDRAVRDLFATAPTAEETAAFIADKTPDALDALVKRLAARMDVVSFSGKLSTTPAKFRVVAADANADKLPRVVLGPGEYPLPSASARRGDATLKIVGRPVGDRRTNDAQLIFEGTEFTGALPPDPYKLEVPDGWGTWAIVCRPGDGFFYLLHKGGVRKIDYSAPRKVNDTPATDLPVEFRDEVKRQFEIAGVPAAQQAEIFEKPAPPTAPNPEAPRTATAPGRYLIGQGVHLQISQTPVNPYRVGSRPFLQNKATILFPSSDPSDPKPYEIAPPKPWEIELLSGEGSYAFAWVQGSGELWLLRKGENFLWRYRFAADGLKEEGRYDLWPSTVLRKSLRRALQDAMGLRAATDIPPLGDEALEQPAPGPGPRKTAKLKPGTEERLSWGAPVNGLRAALVRMPPETQIVSGAVVDLNVVVQNVSDAPVKLRGGSPLAGVNLKALGTDGTEAELDQSIVDVLSTIDEFTLLPREVAVMSLMSVGIGKQDANAKSTHGRAVGYWVAGDKAIVGFNAEIRFSTPLMGFWSGTLKAPFAVGAR